MANYHLSAKVIGRGSPRTKRLPQSAVGAAAYGSGSRLVDARTGVVYDFRRKPSVIGAGILIPEDAPVWANDREALWNRAERRERRKDAVVCREIEFSLPRELAWPQRERLVRKFLDEQFVRRGMVADYALHDPLARDGRRQPHCHTLLTMRAFSGEEFGDKVRAWNSRALLRLWRAEWSKAANAALHEAGFSNAATLDHRSYRDRGLKVLPTIHEGRRGDGDRRRLNGIIHQRNAIKAQTDEIDGEIFRLEQARSALVSRREAAAHRLSDWTRRRAAARRPSASDSFHATPSPPAPRAEPCKPVEQSSPRAVASKRMPAANAPPAPVHSVPPAPEDFNRAPRWAELRSKLVSAGRKWVDIHRETQSRSAQDEEVLAEMTELRKRVVEKGQAASEAMRNESYDEATRLVDEVWENLVAAEDWIAELDCDDAPSPSGP